MTEIEGDTLPSRYGFYSRYIVLYPFTVYCPTNNIYTILYNDILCYNVYLYMYVLEWPLHLVMGPQCIEI